MMKNRTAWNKGLTKETDTRVCKYAQSKIGKCYESSEVVSARMKKLWQDPTYREKVMKARTSEARRLCMTRAREVLIVSGQPPWNKGKKNCYTEEVRMLMGADKIGKLSTMKSKHFPLEVVEKNRQAQLLNWQKPEYVFKQMKARGVKPNKAEQQLISLITGNNLPYKYVGDGQFILGGKCPDFLNVNGKKQVIELFGTYWHDIFDIAERKEHFRQYGFDTLIIWEDELKDSQKIISKITNFSKLSHATAT